MMKIKLNGMDDEIKAMVESVAYAVELHRLRPDLAGVPTFSAEAQKIAHFFVAGFPKPDQIPDPPCGLPEYRQHTAHDAVNVNDRRHRDWMRDSVCSTLLHGGTLDVAERAWLIYVLSKMKDMPHESKGRAIKGNERIEFMLQLIGFIEYEERKAGKYKPGDVTKRLHDAAEHFGKGFESVNAMYKSKAFKRLRKNLSDRGNIERALSTKTTI
jgi:hypothetical protein